MGKPIAITRSDLTADELRAVAAKCRDGAKVRRLLALGLILEGHTRTEAAKRSGMQRQTLRDWVHRYNQEGVDGLTSGHGPGQPPSLTAEQMSELKALVIKGPDPMENVWEYLRANKLCALVSDSYEAIVDACRDT